MASGLLQMKLWGGGGAGGGGGCNSVVSGEADPSSACEPAGGPAPTH